MKAFLSLFYNALILSYSKIFFSENKITGFFVLLATLTVPHIGLCGVFAAIVANLAAYSLGMDRQNIRQGLYGFNGVLTGLAMGFFYGISIKLLLLLALLCILLTLLTLILNNLFYQQLGFSAMSIPFNIIVGLALVMGKLFTTIHPAVVTPPAVVVTLPIAFFLETISEVLFQGNILAGILVSIGILFYSRIAFILMAVGFIVGIGVSQFFGIDAVNIKQAGFNCMFAALAIGGVWLIPSVGSLVMAMLASVFALIINLHYPLAWPFNIAVVLVLYGLRNRLYPVLGIDLHAGHFISPEENLGKQREQIRQFKHKGFTIALPFYGRWKITQGIDGQHTHKEDWRFAYDFQAVDFRGQLYKHNGETHEDFYAYGLPVLAPADGLIERLIDSTPDNAIGQVNTEERWGNHVIIKHGEGYYSCLAHLKQGSIKVEIGQTVRKGEPIGSCGNSGRSPYPHIHLQFQMRPEVGSPSISFEFTNICVPPLFISKGTLDENTIVQNLTQTKDIERFFPYSLNKEWVFEFNGSPEIWKMEVDFYGNTFLVSSSKVTRLSFTTVNGVLRVGQLEGNRNTGLYLFGSLVSEIPFAQNEGGLVWSAIEPTDYGVNFVVTKLFEILSLIGLGLSTRLDCKTQINNNGFLLTTHPSVYLKTPFKDFRLKQQETAEIVFMAGIGLKTISFGDKKLWLR